MEQYGSNTRWSYRVHNFKICLANNLVDNEDNFKFQLQGSDTLIRRFLVKLMELSRTREPGTTGGKEISLGHIPNSGSGSDWRILNAGKRKTSTILWCIVVLKL